MIEALGISGIIAVITALFAGVGILIGAIVWALGRFRMTESEMADRALEAAQQAIGIQEHELAKVRERFDAHEQERRDLLAKLIERDARIAELSGHEAMLARLKEDNVKLTNALRAVQEKVPVDIQSLLDMVTSVASGAEIRRVNGEAEPPVHRHVLEEKVERRVVGAEEEPETKLEAQARLQRGEGEEE